MQTGIHIGTIVGKESLGPLTESILRIMDAKADQKTIRAALELIGRAASAPVNGVSVSNCHLVGDTEHTHHHYPEPEASDDVPPADDSFGSDFD